MTRSILLPLPLLLLVAASPVFAEPDVLADEIEFVLDQAAPHLRKSGADFFAAAGSDSTAGSEKKVKDWGVALTPYVWFTGFGVKTGGETVSADFSDVAGLTNAGFMVIGTFAWKRWTFSADYTYLDLGDDTTIDRLTANFAFKQNILHLTAGYAVLDHGSLRNPTGARLNLLVGARYWDTQVNATISIPPLLPGGSGTQINIDEGTSWWDLTTGFGARWVLNPKVGFRLWGNIGGFGIGNSSDFTWELGFVTSFLVTKWFGFHVGYRVLEYDRESGGTDTSLTMEGPIVGFTFVF